VGGQYGKSISNIEKDRIMISLLYDNGSRKTIVARRAGFESRYWGPERAVQGPATNHCRILFHDGQKSEAF